MTAYLHEDATQFLLEDASGLVYQEAWDGSVPGYKVDFEQQALAATLSTATTGVALVTGAGPKTIVATPFGAAHGAQAAKFDGSAAQATHMSLADPGDAHTISMYFQFDQIPVTSNAFVRWWDLTAAGFMANLRWSAATQTFGIINANSVVQGSNSTKVFATADQCRIDAQFKRNLDATADIFARLFYGANLNGTTPDETIGAANINVGGSSADLGAIQIGNTQAIAGQYTVDTVRVWPNDIAGWPDAA